MRRVGTFVLFLMLLCGIANATNFDYWWPWIYRYVSVCKTGAVSPDSSVTISNDQHLIYISIPTNFCSGTSSWNQAVIDSIFATNWIAIWSNSVSYMDGRTSAWDQAVADSLFSTNWIITWSNIVDVMNGTTSTWNQAAVDATFMTNWLDTNVFATGSGGNPVDARAVTNSINMDDHALTNLLYYTLNTNASVIAGVPGKWTIQGTDTRLYFTSPNQSVTNYME